MSCVFGLATTSAFVSQKEMAKKQNVADTNAINQSMYTGRPRLTPGSSGLLLGRISFCADSCLLSSGSLRTTSCFVLGTRTTISSNKRLGIIDYICSVWVGEIKKRLI